MMTQLIASFEETYSKSKTEDLLDLLQSNLPDEIPPEDDEDYLKLLRVCRDAFLQDITKGRVILGALLMRASAQLCLRPEIPALTPYMIEDDFIPFIKKQNPQNLTKIFFQSVIINQESTHLFSVILMYQGEDALIELFSAIPTEYKSLLSNELVKTTKGERSLFENLLFLESKNPHTKQHSRPLEILIIQSVKDLTDRLRSNLILDHYDDLTWEGILLLMEQCTSSQVFRLMLMNLPDEEQNILAEKIAVENSAAFLKAVERFQGEEQGLFYSLITSSYKLPDTLVSKSSYYFGTRQSKEELSEILLFRLLQKSSQLLPQLATLLEKCDGPQLTKLFQSTDVNNISLFLYLASSTPVENMIRVLAKAHYAVTDDEKMFDPRKNDFKQMRSVLEDAPDPKGSTGFLGLLSIYQYLAVRLNEGNDDIFQNSLSEFCQMLTVLQTNKTSNTIKVNLKQHCDARPLRRGWSISFGISNVNLSTQRHQEARDKLLELDVDELKAGIVIFQQFIVLRNSADYEVKTKQIDNILTTGLNLQRSSFSFESV